jgi:archaellum biogenesis ATPase FlaH
MLPENQSYPLPQEQSQLLPEDYMPAGHVPHAEPISASFMKAAEEILIPYPSTPITDMPLFNSLVGGFRPYEFTILCGGTGTGKTTLIANWSASWVKQGIPHFVASVETGRTDFVKRVMSAIADEDWNTGDAIPKERVKAFADKYRDLLKKDCLHLSRYENRFSVETLMADIAWMVKHKRIKVALIDNLNFFMEVKSASDQVVEMDRVIHELVCFSKNINVHIVMIMHPKKNSTGVPGRVDSEFDIKGSSTAVQEAYNVFLFNRAHPDLVKDGVLEKFDRELKIQKIRRRGRSQGMTLVLKSQNGVRYLEGGVL